MGQVSVSVKIDPTRGRRAMNARKYKIRKEVDLRGEPFHLQKKETTWGENASTTPYFTEKVHQWATGVGP